MEQAEVAVIGAGPIGLETAVAFKRAGVAYLHLEAGAIGSTMGWWAPGTRYFSSPERVAIAGVPLVVQGEEKATREDYLRYLRHVAAEFGLEVRTFERVVGIERGIGQDEGGFLLYTVRSAHGVGGVEEQRRVERERSKPPFVRDVERSRQPRTYRVEKVVLAIGNMHLPRMAGVPGEDLPHVSHYLEDPHKYYGKRVAIVGGRNSAVEAAIRLYRAGARVTLCQRQTELERERIKYWLLPELEWLIKKKLIGYEPGVHVREITEEAVVAERGASRLEVPADMVLLLTGYVQEPELFEMLGVGLEGSERRPRFDKATMETDVPGVFVAGTAIGGSAARTRVFIENAHEHVERIVRAITGKDVAVRGRAVFEGNEES